MGDLIYYKTSDGYLVKRKSSVSAERLKHDPAYERFREHQSEFGRAGKATKLVRAALWSLIYALADSRMTARLVSTFRNIILTDTTHLRGARNVTHGNIRLLENFDFNANAPFKKIFRVAYTIKHDALSGSVNIHIPAFTPSAMITSPGTATHAILQIMAVTLNFEAEKQEQLGSEKITVPLNTTVHEPISIDFAVSTNLSEFTCLACDIRFFQEVNGTLNPMKNNTGNASAIIRLYA